MLNKITSRYGSGQAMCEYVKEAERMIEAYGWQERTVMPYGYPVKVTSMIQNFKDFGVCTRSSQDMLIAEANGLSDILNAWERHAQEPKVKVRNLRTGNVVEVPEEYAQLLLGDENIVLA